MNCKKIKAKCFLLLLLPLFMGCSFGSLIKPAEFYSDYTEFMLTEDGYYGELNLMFDEDARIDACSAMSIKFFGPLCIKEGDREFAKDCAKYSPHICSDTDLEYMAAFWAHFRSEFQGFCRIFVLEKAGEKWVLNQEKFLDLKDLEDFGALLFKDPETLIIKRANRGPVPNTLVLATNLDKPLKRGNAYKVKILVMGNERENLPKGFFAYVWSYWNPFEQCRGKGIESWSQEHQDSMSKVKNQFREI